MNEREEFEKRWPVLSLDAWTPTKDIAWMSWQARANMAAPAYETCGVKGYRKAFVCKSCGGVYADEAVTQCDCLPEKREFEEMLLVPASAVAAPAQHEPEEFEDGDWTTVRSVDEMQTFYMSRLPTMREAAKNLGYALGLHGSTRRDFDLIAVPWVEDPVSADELAHALACAACGISRDGPYQWEQKPFGRIATSIPICMTTWHDMASAGHLDLSVITAGVQPDHAEALAAPVQQEPVGCVISNTGSEFTCETTLGTSPLVGADVYLAPQPYHAEVLTAAARDVLAERKRQTTKEGYSDNHDDLHVNDEIAALACFYAMPAGVRDWPATETGYGETFGSAIVPEGWETKTGNRRSELLKAGALILAEIERLDRASEKGGA